MSQISDPFVRRAPESRGGQGIPLTCHLVDEAMVQFLPAADVFVIGDSFRDFGLFALGKDFLETNREDEGLIEALSEARLEGDGNWDVDCHVEWWKCVVNGW